MNSDKIRKHIGETVYFHIQTLTAPQLIKMLTSLEAEIKREPTGTARLFKLKAERQAILNKLN